MNTSPFIASQMYTSINLYGHDFLTIFSSERV